MISRQTYYAFGAMRTSDNAPITSITEYNYSGQPFDTSDGLSYYQARYYDSALNRFIQPDSIVPNLYNPQDLNRYSYTRNNPVRYTDPTGHFPDWFFDVLSVAFDVAQLWAEPSWENAGWLTLDTVLWVVPVVPAGAGPAAKAVKATENAVKVADKASDVAHAVDAAKDLIKGGLNASERAERIRSILNTSIHGTEKTRAVIGYYPEYKNAMGKFFSLSPEVWSEFQKCLPKCANAFWEVNEQFLKDMIKQGVEIQVERAARPMGEGLEKELEFLDDLVKRGYMYYDEVRDVYIPITSPW